MAVLDNIRTLSDGWMGSGSLAPRHEEIDRLFQAARYVDNGAHVAPAADGSIIIEWSAGEHDYLVSLERSERIIFIEETADGELVRELEEEFSEEGLQRFLQGDAR